MGWTRIDSKLSTDQILTECGMPLSRVVVKAAKLNVIYVAVRSEKDPTKVFGVVVLVRRTRESTLFKDIDEGMGPNECDAPAKVLDALTPLDGSDQSTEWARQWRKACHARCILTRMRAADAAKFKPGVRLRVKSDIKLTNGRTIKAGTEVVRENARSLTFEPVVGFGGRFRLRKTSVSQYLEVAA